MLLIVPTLMFVPVKSDTGKGLALDSIIFGPFQMSEGETGFCLHKNCTKTGILLH